AVAPECRSERHRSKNQHRQANKRHTHAILVLELTRENNCINFVGDSRVLVRWCLCVRYEFLQTTLADSVRFGDRLKTTHRARVSVERFAPATGVQRHEIQS